MRTFTITFNLKQLLVSIFSLVIVFSVYSFVFSSNTEMQTEQINSTTASTYYQAYKEANQNGFQHVGLNVEQWTAMRQIKGNPNVEGFRIYMGIDGESNVSIVVGVNESGADLTSASDEIRIVRDDRIFGGCPDVCDNQSSIVTGEEE